jgi:hypothetical protein
MKIRGITVVALLAMVGMVYAGRAQASGIEGTYRLVKRVLPDGTVVKPPAVVGFETYGHGYRNFNVKWTQADGKPASLSLTSRYELKGGQYCEQPLLWVSNNVETAGLSYTWPPAKEQCSAVKSVGGKLTFAFNGEPVVATFDSNGFSAVAKGMFTDYWERLK